MLKLRTIVFRAVDSSAVNPGPKDAKFKIPSVYGWAPDPPKRLILRAVEVKAELLVFIKLPVVKYR